MWSRRCLIAYDRWPAPGRVRVWDLTSGTQRAELTGHPGEVSAVACTVVDDRPVAVTGADDEMVRVWDLTSGTQGTTIPMPQEAVQAIAVGARNDLVVACGWEIIVLDRTTHQPPGGETDR